jgi:hypothetical protein
MHVRNRGAGLRGLDRRFGNLRRRYRDGRVLAYGIACTGYGAGEDDVPIHVTYTALLQSICFVAFRQALEGKRLTLRKQEVLF